MRKTFHRIDEEDCLVVVLTGERMSALYIPIARFDDVRKEAGKAARFKIVEDGIDVGSRCVGAICCCRYGIVGAKLSMLKKIGTAASRKYGTQKGLGLRYNKVPGGFQRTLS